LKIEQFLSLFTSEERGPVQEKETRVRTPWQSEAWLPQCF
jgi:hypothetical protein